MLCSMVQQGDCMTLTDLASFGSLISALAVAGSLIYLGLQTHQAAKHTRAMILQGRVERVVAHHLAIADSDLVSAWIIENGDTPTAENIRRRQFWLQGMAYDLSWEDTFAQHESGLLGAEQFADFRAHIVTFLKAPALHRYFSNRPVPARGPTKFHRFIEQVLAESAVPSLETGSERRS